MGAARFVLALSLSSAIGAEALAHPAVDEGRAHFEQGDMLAAIEAFDRAEAAADLGVSELEVLLETRALAYRVLGDAGAVEAELMRLASVAPRHQFSAEAPPEVRELFTRVRGRLAGPVRVEVRAASTPRGLSLRAAATDPARVVRRVELSARPEGGPWQRSAEGALELRVAAGDAAEYWAVAIGPGGAPVAALGARDAPLRAVRTGSGEGGGSAWPWIGLGAGVLVVAGVVAVVVLVGSAEPETQPGLPTEEPL